MKMKKIVDVGVLMINHGAVVVDDDMDETS
jgi:ribulose-5-phosphate 4-epimerase/fuculose-1-phosphate aldolase